MAPSWAHVWIWQRHFLSPERVWFTRLRRRRSWKTSTISSSGCTPARSMAALSWTSPDQIPPRKLRNKTSLSWYKFAAPGEQTEKPGHLARALLHCASRFFLNITHRRAPPSRPDGWLCSRLHRVRPVYEASFASAEGAQGACFGPRPGSLNSPGFSFAFFSPNTASPCAWFTWVQRQPGASGRIRRFHTHCFFPDNLR